MKSFFGAIALSLVFMSAVAASADTARLVCNNFEGKRMISLKLTIDASVFVYTGAGPNPKGLPEKDVEAIGEKLTGVDSDGFKVTSSRFEKFTTQDALGNDPDVSFRAVVWLDKGDKKRALYLDEFLVQNFGNVNGMPQGYYYGGAWVTKTLKLDDIEGGPTMIEGTFSEFQGDDGNVSQPVLCKLIQ